MTIVREMTRTLLQIGVALIVCATAFDAHAAGKRRALLVAINDYSASRFGRPRIAPSADRDWRDLAGTVNDVATLREMLVQLYGFDERDIVVLTDQQSSRNAILRALDQQLVKPAAHGDVLLFYFAGHGSQRRNSLSDEPDRMDESLVPADSRMGIDDIRDKELRPQFNAILDKGARLTVILDKCNSGSGARGLPTGARPRGIRPDLRDVADRRHWGPRPEKRGALVLAATQDFDQAWEASDDEGKIRGAFTWALLRAMRDSLPGESAGETFLRARARLRGETPFQEPVIAGNSETRLAPLFGSRIDRRGDRTIVAVEKVREDGTVVLQGGWAAGLSVGSELRVISDRDISARLKITALVGANRSEARIEAGRTLPVAVRPGATLEVVGWASPPGRALRVWMPRVAGDVAGIASLARQLAGACARRRVRWVADPLDVTPTYVLRRTTAQWELVAASGALELVGASTGDAVAAIAKLPIGSSLFVQFAAPSAMIDGIAVGPGTDREGIVPVDRPEDADYILAGRHANRRVEYAWVRPAVRSDDRRRTSLPLRTDWIPEDGRDDTLRDSVDALRGAVLRLRRIHAWTLLDSPAEGRSPLRLGLRRTRTGELAKDVLIGNETYELVLHRAAASPQKPEHRYVYVFTIDSFGTSTLLYPHPDSGSVENRVSSAASEIRLGAAGTFEVAEPYGVDTYFLLTTDEALANPWVVEWNGVRTRSPESPTALEILLMLTGSAARSGGSVTPANWSLERVVFESVPPHKPSASTT